MVIYLSWSEQVATWPIFPLSSHNDLQTSISNMASSKHIARLNAEMAPSCFEDSYWPIQIWYIALQTVHTSQSLFFRKIVNIEHFALRAAILDECQNHLGGRGAVWEEARKIVPE